MASSSLPPPPPPSPAPIHGYSMDLVPYRMHAPQLQTRAISLAPVNELHTNQHCSQTVKEFNGEPAVVPQFGPLHLARSGSRKQGVCLRAGSRGQRSSGRVAGVPPRAPDRLGQGVYRRGEPRGAVNAATRREGGRRLRCVGGLMSGSTPPPPLSLRLAAAGRGHLPLALSSVLPALTGRPSADRTLSVWAEP